MNKWFLKNLIWILIGIVLVSLDLLVKYLAKTYISNPIEIIKNFFYISFNMNPGIAFSIPIPNAVMIILTPILLCVVVWFVINNYSFDRIWTKLGLVLILAGGLGNFINRIWTASVIDMISFSFWPSFNLADSYLTIGAFLLIVFYGKIHSSHVRRN